MTTHAMGAFVAHAVVDSCRFNETGIVFIDPGSPSRNAWIEPFNRRFRDKLLYGSGFNSLLDIGMTIEA